MIETVYKHTNIYKHTITNCNKCYEDVSVWVLQEADGEMQLGV